MKIRFHDEIIHPNSLYLSLSLCLSVCLSLSVCLFLSFSIYLSTSLSLFLSLFSYSHSLIFYEFSLSLSLSPLFFLLPLLPSFPPPLSITSMIDNPTPTRAEASDCATAIYDSADAGVYPIDTSVSTLRQRHIIDNRLIILF